MQDPVAAAREIDRVGGHPSMVQVMIPMAAAHPAIGDPRYLPILEAAVRNDLVIAVHQSAATSTPFGYPRHLIEWHTAHPHSAMCEVISLICNGAFERFPDLRLAVLEAGFTWLPHLMWRLDQQYREFRVEVPWVTRPPSEQIRSSGRVTTQPMEPIEARHLLQLVDMMGSDELIVYSSDYPHFDYDAPARALPAATPDDLRTKILKTNGARFFRF
jgi:predicted TIM-barrel fold metal-dependent hydrolase